MNKLVVSIVTFNTKDLTLKCLESLFKSKQNNSYKVVIVDNNSEDNTVEAIKKKYPQVDLIQNKENVGFGRAHNQVFEQTKSEYLLLLNSDTEIEDHTLDELITVMEKENYSILAPKLIYVNGSLQPNIGNLPSFWNIFFWLSNLDTIFGRWFQLPSYHLDKTNLYHGTHQVGWVSGAVLLIKKSDFEIEKLFDTKIFMYGEDTDLCIRAHKKGLKVGWTDVTTVLHISGGSSKDPHYRQWLGEYQGLIYIYKKYYGKGEALILKMLIYFFIFLRVVAFSFIGKANYSTTYAKIIKNL